MIALGILELMIVGCVLLVVAVIVSAGSHTPKSPCR